MDQKEEAIGEFFRAIQMALNNAAYFRGHPYFVKTVESFKEKLDAILLFCNPVILEVSPTKIIFDGRLWEKTPLYEGIAQHLHVRKIEKITISSGYRLDELSHFLNVISLPARELEQQKGVCALLADKSPSFSVQALDYSSLLRKEGLEISDAWVYILQAALANNDTRKLAEYTETFGQRLTGLDYRLISENSSANQIFKDFFAYLKEHSKFDFDRCVKDMYEFLSQYSSFLQESDYAFLSKLFEKVDIADYARLLSEEFLFKDRVDALNFRFFCHLSGEGKQKSITEALFSDKVLREKLRGNVRVIHNIQGLLSPASDKYISAVYRNTLMHFLQEISLGGMLVFDHALLESNYRFVLLNLILEEADCSVLALIANRIATELHKAIDIRDSGYIQLLCVALTRREKENSACAQSFEAINVALGNCTEQLLWGKVLLDADCILERIDRNRFSAAYFLDKFFEEKLLSSLALSFFFKTHPQDVPVLYKRLSERSHEVEFIIQFIETAAAIHPPLSLSILQNLYAQANEFVRLEILKAMKNIPGIDVHFLRGLLRIEQGQLKKEALTLIVKDSDGLREALRELLFVPNPWGFQDARVLENIDLVADLRLLQAKDDLALVLKRAPLWSFRLKKRIREILALWNS